MRNKPWAAPVLVWTWRGMATRVNRRKPAAPTRLPPRSATPKPAAAPRTGPPGAAGTPRVKRELIVPKRPEDAQAKADEQAKEYERTKAQNPAIPSLEYGDGKPIAFSHIPRSGNTFQLPGLPNEIHWPRGVMQRVVDGTLLSQLVNWTLDGSGAGATLSPIAAYSIDYNLEGPYWKKYEANVAYLQKYVECRPDPLKLLQGAKGRLSESTVAMMEGVKKHSEAMEKPTWFDDPRVNEQVLVQSTSPGNVVNVLYDEYAKSRIDPMDDGEQDEAMLGDGFHFYASSGFADEHYVPGAASEALNAAEFATYMHGNADQFVKAFNDRSPAPKGCDAPSGGMAIRAMLLSRVLLGCPAIVNAESWKKNETKFGGVICDRRSASACADEELLNPFTSLLFEADDPARNQFTTRLQSLQLPAFVVYYVEEPCPLTKAPTA